MNRPILSVIIPVYNAERYILNTINMVLSQTFNNFELILVDDGSHDDSCKICDEAAKKDKRIIVVHKPNEGASSARNAGIEVAKTDLVTFIDADDEVSELYLEILMSDFNRTPGVDFVLQGMIQKWSDSYVVFKAKPSCYNMQEDSQGFFNSLKINDFSGPCCKIFRRDLLNDNNIRFSRNIIYAEDLDFILRYLLHCRMVVVSSSTNYYYIMHGNTVSSRIYEFDVELSGVNQLLLSYNAVVTKYKCKAVIEYRKKSICDYLWRVIFSNYRHEYNRTERLKNFQKIDSTLLSFFKKYYEGRTVFTKIVKTFIVFRWFSLLDMLLYKRFMIHKNNTFHTIIAKRKSINT